MQGKGVSKYQSLENKSNWNWLDSRYAWKKSAKLEISLYPNPLQGSKTIVWKKLNIPKIVSKEILVLGQKSKWNLAKTGLTENKELERC